MHCLIQGFHVLLDGDNGFGGVASNVLQLIKEEYPNKTTFAIPSFSAHAPDDSFNRTELLTNTGLVMESLFENSDIFSVISLDPEWFSSKSRNFTHLQYKVLSLFSFTLCMRVLNDYCFPVPSSKSRWCYISNSLRCSYHAFAHQENKETTRVIRLCKTFNLTWTQNGWFVLCITSSNDRCVSNSG